MIPLHTYQQGIGFPYRVSHNRSPVGHFEVGNEYGEIFIVIDIGNSRFNAVCLEHLISVIRQQTSERGPSNRMFVGNDHRKRDMPSLCFYVPKQWQRTAW